MGKKEYNGRKWRVKRSKLGECPECHYLVKATDPWRGETVCKQCGLVISDRAPALPDQELMKDRSSDEIHRGSKTTQDERNALRNAGKPVINHTDMKDWRAAQYLMVVDKVANEFMMTRHQKKYIREIIEQYGLKKFHRWLNAEAIITGLCMCLMRKNGRLINFKRKFVRKTGLTRAGYKAIERKAKGLGLF